MSWSSWRWVKEYVVSYLRRSYDRLKDLSYEYKIKKDRLLLTLPLTKEHLRIRQRVFRWQCISTLRRFRQVVEIDLNEKQRANLRYHIVHAKNLRRREILREEKASLLLPLFVLPTCLPYFLILSQLKPTNLLEELVLFTTYLCIVALAFTVPSWFLDSEIPISRIDLGITILALFTAASIRGYPELLMIITAASAATFGAVVCVFAWAAALVGIDRVARRRDCTKHPESHITVSLLELQWELEAGGYNRGLRADRLKVAKSLDDIATLFGSACSRAHHTGDSSMDVRLGLQFQEVANGFRELKHWVLFPRADTREHLLARLRLYIPAVITGAWDELPRSEYREPKVSKKRVVLRFFKHLSISAIPMAMLFIVESAPWAAVWSESFRRFEIGAFAFVWACFWMLLAFYERIGPQLEHLRKALEMLAVFRK